MGRIFVCSSEVYRSPEALLLARGEFSQLDALYL